MKTTQTVLRIIVVLVPATRRARRIRAEIARVVGYKPGVRK